jgi:hypothetical protein
MRRDSAMAIRQRRARDRRRRGEVVLQITVSEHDVIEALLPSRRLSEDQRKTATLRTDGLSLLTTDSTSGDIWQLIETRYYGPHLRNEDVVWANP